MDQIVIVKEGEGVVNFKKFFFEGDIWKGILMKQGVNYFDIQRNVFLGREISKYKGYEERVCLVYLKRVRSLWGWSRVIKEEGGVLVSW